MKTEQRKWTHKNGWETVLESQLGQQANLVLAFGCRNVLSNADRYNEIKQFYPNATILTGSTSGEILDVEVNDDTISLTAVQLEHTGIKNAQLKIAEMESSYAAGKALADQLNSEGLAHIFVLSDGLKVNGSELVKGLNNNLPKNVSVTGGLAGDAARFEKTLVGINQHPGEGNVVAIGFYGSRLKVGHGSRGGWDPFGPERTVTKSKGNVLYELDGQSALALYKNYLGDKAAGLPGTGLLFPLSIREKTNSTPIVRTLLAIDEKEQSMTFAGDIPQGAIAQLMKASFERLIDGANNAAENTLEKLSSGESELSILISCVGRKLVLGQRIEEEVESVRDVLGAKTAIAGFYSYGEISPLTPNFNCELHNQTMTITTFSES
jgi:hypothetical protein